MLTYVILRPESDEPLGTIRSALPPTAEDMADHLAALCGFENRDHFLQHNPDLSLGYAPIH